MAECKRGVLLRLLATNLVVTCMCVTNALAQAGEDTLDFGRAAPVTLDGSSNIAPAGALPGGVSIDTVAPTPDGAGASTAESAPSSELVIDNDDGDARKQVETTFQWSELPNAPGQTVMITGAKFPVKVVSELSSKTARAGDPVEAQVRIDIRIGGKLIAAKGSRVVGHVFDVMPARRLLVAEVSPHRWWRANGTIGIKFDEIITDDGQHIPLNATPAQQARIVINKAEGRIMGVNHKGEVASPLSIQLKEQAIHYAIRGVASFGGVFSMGAVPVAYAVIGAISPSFAFMHPVGQNVPHRRIKGAAMGFVNGLPGGFLIADSVIKGVEASIKPGDEFLVELKQDFDGQPSTDSEMLGGAEKDVHGEIVKRRKSKGSKPAQQAESPISVRGT
jgi:hypothetical protein